MEQIFDLVVLGAGSGGLAAAKRAARYGAKVAIVEGDRVGGTCVIRGCVPKKLLVYGSLLSEQLEGASSYGVSVAGATFDTSVLLRNVRQEVDRLNALHIDFLAKAGVELITGWGRFLDPHRIGVSKTREGEIDQVLQAKRVMIAVGGRPFRPNIPGAELAWISDDMFLQQRFPDRVVVVGAGFIACEFAGILRGLGVAVTQLVRGEQLLRGFDSELSGVVQEGMQSKGIDLRFGQGLAAIESTRSIWAQERATEGEVRMCMRPVLPGTSPLSQTSSCGYSMGFYAVYLAIDYSLGQNLLRNSNASSHVAKADRATQKTQIFTQSRANGAPSRQQGHIVLVINSATLCISRHVHKLVDFLFTERHAYR